MSAYDEALSKIFEERLRSFYTKYDASKLASVDTILIKYKGKEEALFKAMVKKYGPEPTPEEMDDDDDDGDDDDDDDDDNATASPKDPAAEADDAIAEEEEEGPDEEEAEAARPPGESPLYCSICGVPPEFCEYGDSFDQCSVWIAKNCPHLLKKVEEEEGDDAKKKKGKRGGGVIRKKELAVEKQRCIVTKEVRARKKVVTVIEGLETFGIKLKDAAKSFGKKFACSATVKEKDTGGQEIVVQGDVIDDFPDFLKSEYGIGPSKIFTRDAGKVVSLR